MRLRWKHPSSNGAPITSYNVEVAGCKNISFDVMSGEGCENEEESSVVQEYDVTELQPNTLYRLVSELKLSVDPSAPCLLCSRFFFFCQDLNTMNFDLVTFEESFVGRLPI